MKRVVLFALFLTILITPNGKSAPKKIDVNKMQFLASIGTPDEVSGVVASGDLIVVYGTKAGKAYARAIDSTSKELWNIFLSDSDPSIATSAAVDASGDIWIVGAIPVKHEPTESISPPSVLNPDNTIISQENIVSDLKVIVIWKVNSLGELISSYSFSTNHFVSPNAIAVDNRGVSIVGVLATDLGNSGFLINTNEAGAFSKLLQIGKSATAIESVIRHGDGSMTLAGSSSETIEGKKVVGVADGILMRVSKELKISMLVRSSFTKSRRIWSSSTPSLLLGGEIQTGNKQEAAVTKFTSKLLPKWSYRFPSLGRVVTQGSEHLLFVSTTGKIDQLNWNPKTPTPLLITFDAQGSIVAASSAPVDQKDVIAMVDSKKLGL